MFNCLKTKKNGKPILCMDFDGVIHSYDSGWQGATVIPDLPVPGALDFIIKAMDTFQVAIHSSRSHQFGGRRAMKRWLRKVFEDRVFLYAENGTCLNPAYQYVLASGSGADPWEYEVRYASRKFIRSISWPIFKPPAIATIDDRAYRFEGTFPGEPSVFLDMKPWNKKGQRKEKGRVS